MLHQDTIRLRVRADSLDAPAERQALERAANVLRSGGTVAFPTETVYGLGANALDAQAVEGIFRAKERPAWDPLIVHVSDMAMLRTVVAEVSVRAQKLIERFWPGPLTLLLPKMYAVPDSVTAGRPLVGVRQPAHPVAQALIAVAGVPVAAPSANRFGNISPTTAQHVLDDLNGRIDLILDAGATSCGVESTVVAVGEQSIVLYRPGAIAAEEIEAVAGPVMLFPGATKSSRQGVPIESLPSPGMGIRHYAPRARVVTVETAGLAASDAQARWLELIRTHVVDGLRIGVMLPDDWPLPKEFAGDRFAWGSWNDDRMLAQRLYAGLRALDAMGADVILCPLPSPQGLGAALRDRLEKAAREK